MLKMLNACTTELDIAETAVTEILEQLNLSENLLKNSTAIITAYKDTDEEVIKAVAKSLPFESIGMTTFMSATDKQSNYMQITVSVLTSDDVEFTVGCSAEIIPESEKEVHDVLLNTISKVKNPQAIFGSIPLLQYASVDYFIKLVNKINPNLLFFSGIAIDNSKGYKSTKTIFNGEMFGNRFPFIILSKENGKLNLDFSVATIPHEKALRGRDEAIVTKSADSQIIEIDNAPAINYLKSLNLAQYIDGNFVALEASPFIVDFKDGTPAVMRAIFDITPDGTAIIGGDIPVGSSIYIGQLDVNEIVNTTKKVLSEFTEKNKDANGFILYSCCGRYFNLSFDGSEETEAIKEIISKTQKPFLFAYSGGEICPVHNYENKKIINCGHSYTCIMAAFK